MDSLPLPLPLPLTIMHHTLCQQRAQYFFFFLMANMLSFFFLKSKCYCPSPLLLLLSTEDATSSLNSFGLRYFPNRYPLDSLHLVIHKRPVPNDDLCDGAAIMLASPVCTDATQGMDGPGEAQNGHSRSFIRPPWMKAQHPFPPPQPTLSSRFFFFFFFFGQLRALLQFAPPFHLNVHCWSQPVSD